MPSYHLNHINIRTADLDATRNFYADVLGLVDGPRPHFPSPGYCWMYAGDTAVVHISPSESDGAPRTNPLGMGDGLDHFAMSGAGLQDQLATLKRHGIEYEKRLAGEARIIQVYFEDPNGVLIELIFDPETEGVTAENFEEVVV